MTIIEAPSGCGKTMALTNYMEKFQGKEDIRVYWVSLFRENAAYSWSLFHKALMKIDSESAPELAPFAEYRNEKLPHIIEIIEGLSCAETTYVIIDNFETVLNNYTSRLLMALAAHKEKNLHFIVCRRQLGTDPTFQHLENHLIYRIEASNFMFTEQDIATYFAKVGLGISGEESIQLHALTNGWILAIYLQLLYFSKTKQFNKGDLAKTGYVASKHCCGFSFN